MELKNIKKDRSGLSTILIVVIVAVILVAAAGAAYIVLSNNSDKPVKPTEEIAPGTIMEYDFKIDGLPTGSFSIAWEGQNAEEYLVKIAYEFNMGTMGTIEVSTYSLSPKTSEAPVIDPNAVLKKVETIKNYDTGFDGKKTVEKWEYTEKIGGVDYKGYLYIAPSNSVLYKFVMPTYTGTVVAVYEMTLTFYELKMQKTDSYKESEQIGRTTRFALSTDPTKIVEVRCVADCINDKYGVVYDFTYVVGDFLEYFLCVSPNGKITGATYISGDRWQYKDEIAGFTNFELNIYYNDSTNSLYKIVLTKGGNTYTFNLVTT